MTRNAAIDRLRQEQRRPMRTALDLDEMLETVGRYTTVDDPSWQDGQLLRALLARLPSEQIQVLELAYFQGMSHSEIAQRLNLPLGTVKTRVRLGLQKLKDLWFEASGYHRER